MIKRIRGNLLLLLAALIWGVAFVAQSEGMKYVGPFTFIAVRNVLAFLVLLVFLGMRGYIRRYKKKEQTGAAEGESRPEGRKTPLAGGIVCGVALFVASALQQIGIQYTPESGKAGFITALYIILVPVCGIFRKKKISRQVWLAVAVSLAGMYLLCITDGFRIARGDCYLILCAVAFAGHILVIDRFSPESDGAVMSCIQFFVCAALGAVGTLLTEQPQAAQIGKAWLPLVYAGVLSSGVAYTLQIVAQKDTEPTVASLLMSLESVFAALGGFVILGQVLSLREVLGCMLMLAAIFLAQVVHSEKVCYDKKEQKKSDGTEA